MSDLNHLFKDKEFSLRVRLELASFGASQIYL